MSSIKRYYSLRCLSCHYVVHEQISIDTYFEYLPICGINHVSAFCRNCGNNPEHKEQCQI